jgi:1,4-alpha-glucan branching enzyme
VPRAEGIGAVRHDVTRLTDLDLHLFNEGTHRGAEIGQWAKWCHDRSLDWHLLARPEHRGIELLVGDLNRLYRDEPALHQLDAEPAGFEWIDASDADHSILSFLRRPRGGPALALVCNFTPVPRYNYRVGVPSGGNWEEVLNSDAAAYGGSGQGNLGGVEAVPFGWHGRPWCLSLTVPPLAVVFLRQPGGGDA